MSWWIGSRAVSRSRNSVRNEHGFTLLEVLVAFAIMSVAMVAVMQAFSGGLDATRRTAAANDALGECPISAGSRWHRVGCRAWVLQRRNSKLELDGEYCATQEPFGRSAQTGAALRSLRCRCVGDRSRNHPSQAVDDQTGGGAMNRSDTDTGFTLVELLVATTLLALLSVVLFGGLRFGARAWESGSASIERTGEVQAVQELLRRTLSEIAVSDLAGAEQRQSLQGKDGLVSFFAPLPRHAGLGGFGRYRLTADDAGRFLFAGNRNGLDKSWKTRLRANPQ